MSDRNQSRTEVVTEVIFLGKLVERIKGGRIRVPEFQRPFVWKQQDMHALLESVLSGYPIGSILLWDTDEDISSRETVGPIPVGPGLSGTVGYILDGQQRLATLAGTLLLENGGLEIEYQVDWRVYYNMKSREFERAHRTSVKPWQFPVASLLSTSRFLAAGRQMEEHADRQLLDQWLDEADRVANAFRNYQMPIIKIRDASLQHAVEVFARLNRKGRKISADQMVSALTYKQGHFHLAEELDKFKSVLEVRGFGGLNRVFLLRAVLAALGRDIYLRDWTARIATPDMRLQLPTALHSAKQGVTAALGFLERLGVTSDRLLPYGLQLVLLSEFFRHSPNPTPDEATLLERWFWVTSFTGWFGTISTSKATHALAEMRALAQKKKAVFSVVNLKAAALPFPERFDPRAARVRAFMLYLASLKPKWQHKSKTYELDPGGLLSDKRTRALGHVVESRVLDDPKLARSPANRMYVESVGSNSPSSELKRMSGECQVEVLESHGFVANQAIRQLKDNKYKDLIRARREALIEGERAFLEERQITLPTQRTARSVADSDTSEDDD